ncbi:uncharacterized protein KY384_003079 [Bacidia gigantensis]|uniref:uncharacterized protein n=1 Tax=Bacidia gigantensis TaxID=2732470 RepID=UPI001D038C1F|nr:uncharacterized protein KY384_003079 [Bacidia gigantensis]KAG8531450.1 hypothetical protein KY384_003079 [Bacidia gigantensis]
MYTILAISLAVLVAWCLRGQRSPIRRHGKRLPRPPGTLPLAGNGIWFLQPRHKLLDWFSDCERQTGFSTYEISVPSLPPGVVINDPANVEHVLKNNDLFIKGDFFRSRSWDLFGHGIINADGELWKIQRKAGLRFFSNANLKLFIDDILPSLLNDTRDFLYHAASSGDKVDLQAVFHELTTRLMGNVAYDMDMPTSLPFSKAFDFASGAIGDRFQNPFWKVKEIIWGAPLQRAVAQVKRFGDAIVSTAIEKRANVRPRVAGHGRSGTDMLQSHLIDSLLDHIEDRAVVADAAMNYLSAAQSLTWAFYLLMRSPSVAEKVVAELQLSSCYVEENLRLDFNTVQPQGLPYTMAVFNETLRLYPPVPVELKECTADTTFPDGTWLPQGSIAIWAPWSIGRSQQTWGQDADKFRPERWLTQDKDGETILIVKTAFEFPVFNGGPRSCLGKRMAELLAVYVVADLSYHFKFCEDQYRSTRTKRSQNSLTLPMEGGLLVCNFWLAYLIQSPVKSLLSEVCATSGLATSIEVMSTGSGGMEMLQAIIDTTLEQYKSDVRTEMNAKLGQYATIDGVRDTIKLSMETEWNNRSKDAIRRSMEEERPSHFDRLQRQIISDLDKDARQRQEYFERVKHVPNELTTLRIYTTRFERQFETFRNESAQNLANEIRDVRATIVGMLALNQSLDSKDKQNLDDLLRGGLEEHNQQPPKGKKDLGGTRTSQPVAEQGVGCVTESSKAGLSKKTDQEALQSSGSPLDYKTSEKQKHHRSQQQEIVIPKDSHNSATGDISASQDDNEAQRQDSISSQQSSVTLQQDTAASQDDNAAQQQDPGTSQHDVSDQQASTSSHVEDTLEQNKPTSSQAKDGPEQQEPRTAPTGDVTGAKDLEGLAEEDEGISSDWFDTTLDF